MKLYDQNGDECQMTGLPHQFYDKVAVDERLADLERANLRYELLRTFNVQQFKNLYETNITTGIPFDQLVDNIINDRKDANSTL